MDIVIASLFIALLSLTGALIFKNSPSLEGRYPYAVPLAIGMFLGVIFFELIPETMEMGGESGSVAIVTGFIGFYLLAHALRTYHHHHAEEEGCDSCGKTKATASLLLVGDAVHNFADGIVLASAFLVNPAVGIATTVAIALHEIPQEIAEFSVLMKAGYTRSRAAFLNALSALSVVVGALLTVFLAGAFAEYLWVLTGLAAGNLLYIAASDLLPDMHGDHITTKRFAGLFIAMLLGMTIIVSVTELAHEVVAH